MILRNYAELEKEIDRVQAAIDSTDSDFLRSDYGKYLKRLKKQAKGAFKREMG